MVMLAAAPRSVNALPAVPRNPGLVIAVPDLMLRDRLATHFVGAGYRVWPVPGGAEAVEICQRHAGEVDAVLADVRLTDISPQVLLDSLARHVPAPGCFFLADRLQSSPALAARLRGAGVLPRSAPVTAIAELIQEVVAGGGRRRDD